MSEHLLPISAGLTVGTLALSELMVQLGRQTGESHGITSMCEGWKDAAKRPSEQVYVWGGGRGRASGR